MSLSWLRCAALLLVCLSGCSEKKPVDFKFVAGSENKTLEPIVQEFCKAHNMVCAFDYKGSIDIGAMLELSGAVPVVIKSLVFPASTALGRAVQ